MSIRLWQPVVINRKGTGGGGGSFPTTVTSSGSSLPATTGYSDGDTFLNTSDKKIYTAEANGYAINSSLDTTISDGLLNTTEGILDGFYSGNRKFTINNIQSNSFKIIIPFKTSSDIQTEQYIFQLINADSVSSIEYLKIKSNGNGSIVNTANANYWDWYVEANKSYVFEITWTAGAGDNYSAKTKLYDENGVQIGYEKQDVGTSSSTKKIQLGAYLNSASSFTGQILKNIGDYNFSFNDTDIIVPNVVWDSGTDLTEGQYLDTTNSKLIFYKDDEITEVVDLSGYKLKATTTTIDTASITVSEIKANTNYVFSNNAITSITLSGCETSFDETTIEFTTGSTAPTLTDNSGITWVDGSAPTLNASKSYIIVIFNKIGFVKEY